MQKPQFFLLLIIGFFIAIQSAAAQATISDEEKAVFAYFKLTDQTPDFMKWVKNSTKYQDARSSEKVKILEGEKERLSWAFGKFDTTKDFISIRRNIRLETFTNQDGERILKTRFVDDSHNETPYFQIPYGNESIALIVEELENYKTITLTAKEIPKVKEYFYDSAPYEAIMEVRIRPISADSKNKLFVDYKDQWLMMGDIAYLKIEFYDEFKLEDIAIWDYNAPWYLDESQKALMDMFKRDP